MWRKRIIAVIALATVAVFAAPIPAAAQNVVWTASYYNNATLAGEPVLRRQDGAISFNWGSGSPANGIGNDNFAARWATDVSLNAGTYRFYALADDHVRVIVDFQPVPLIDTFGQNVVGQLITRDITLNSGSHHIQVDYGELTQNAFVFVNFANLATNPQGPNFVAPVNLPVAGGAWTAQYFANPNLDGSPTLIQSESSPSHNWGNGSPVPSIGGDNWSARWTTLQSLNGGTYHFSALADDGVRVFIDGQPIIDQWHVASGQTYAVDLVLGAGQHNILVEYYEASGLAYLDFNISQVSVGVPAPAPTVAPPVSFPAGTTTATVNTGRLNVRAAPDPVNGTILAKIDRGQTFPVVGRNANGSWVQLNVNGTVGWVNAIYVVLSGNTTLPVMQGAPRRTGYFVTATPFAVNMRLGPSMAFQTIGRIPLGQSAEVIGRNDSSTWWNVTFGPISGWVAAQFAVIQGNADVNNIPITG